MHSGYTQKLNICRLFANSLVFQFSFPACCSSFSHMYVTIYLYTYQIYLQHIFIVYTKKYINIFLMEPHLLHVWIISQPVCERLLLKLSGALSLNYSPSLCRYLYFQLLHSLSPVFCFLTLVTSIFYFWHCLQITHCTEYFYDFEFLYL